MAEIPLRGPLLVSLGAVLLLTITLLAVLMAGGSRSAGQRVGLTRPPAAQPLALGLHSHLLWDSETPGSRARTLDVDAASGVSWLRLDVGWCSLEPTRGRFDVDRLARLDAAVNGARARGMRVLLVVWCTPGWANRGRADEVPPSSPDDYAAAIGRLAEHLRGRVDAWEVWNEPDSDEFWAGSDPVAYAALLRKAYRALHAADPDTTVVTGGLVHNNAAWLERLYDAGAKGSFDAVATHPYPVPADAPPDASAARPGWSLSDVEEVRQVMDHHGDDQLPIWFTEVGWSVHADVAGEPGYRRGVTPAEQARFITRTVSMVAAKYPYVTHLFLYVDRRRDGSDDHLNGFGLVDRDFRPSPAYVALQRLAGGTA